ncbi:LysR family transcriptional regulator [Brevundimonas aurantiaca]|jgi:DNA-binding transcriptional LysR family regulator|uniref:LysR family transcriptional regulator n=1 Tax=Brevundimonas aurantiaca TaxID=74316 RepID=UPI0037C19C07
MFDWDDLRVFLAAARSGSLSTASIRLGIDAATVGRRIARLESALKATLLVRSKSGLRLTAAGAYLLETGAQAEVAMEAAASVGHPDRIAGTVRISAAEGFGATILAPALSGLRRQHPHLRIELAASSGFLSPSRREVDMAVTLSAPDSARLVVEPLTPYQLGLYASPEYLERHPTPDDANDLTGHDIVGYVEDLIYAPELRYLDEVSPGLKPVLSSSSIRAQREIIAGTGGIGVLPCFMATGLQRVLPDLWIERRFWLSTHREVHGSARIKAVHAWIKDICDMHRTRLSPHERRGSDQDRPARQGSKRR